MQETLIETDRFLKTLPINPSLQEKLPSKIENFRGESFDDWIKFFNFVGVP